jgi:hypothetical protein
MGTDHPTCDYENQETLEIHPGTRDTSSPGMVVESKTECEMDAAVKRYIRESKCQSFSSKTNGQENLLEE